MIGEPKLAWEPLPRLEWCSARGEIVIANYDLYYTVSTINKSDGGEFLEIQGIKKVSIF